MEVEGERINLNQELTLNESLEQSMATSIQDRVQEIQNAIRTTERLERSTRFDAHRRNCALRLGPSSIGAGLQRIHESSQRNRIEIEVLNNTAGDGTALAMLEARYINEPELSEETVQAYLKPTAA